jgi:glutamate formiminotransferase
MIRLDFGQHVRIHLFYSVPLGMLALMGDIQSVEQAYIQGIATWAGISSMRNHSGYKGRRGANG